MSYLFKIRKQWTSASHMNDAIGNTSLIYNSIQNWKTKGSHVCTINYDVYHNITKLNCQMIIRIKK